MQPAHSLQSLWFSAALVGLNQTVLITCSSLIRARTGLPLDRLGFVLSISLVLFAISAPFWAARSDRVRTQYIIYMGLFGYFLANLALFILLLPGPAQALGPDGCFVILLFSRIVYGLTASSLVPVTQAWLLRTYADRRTAISSRFSATLALGRFMGPLLVATLLPFHPLAPVFTLVLIPLVIAASLARSKIDGEPLRVPRGNLIETRLIPLGLIAVASTFIFGCFQYVLGPHLEHRLLLSEVEATQTMGYLLMLSGLVTFLVAHLFSRRELGLSLGVIPFCFLLLAASALGIGYGESLWIIVPGVALAASVVAVLTPVYTSAMANQLSTQQGKVSAYLSVFHMTGYGLGTWLGGGLWESEPAHPFLLCAGVAISGAAWATLCYNTTRHESLRV